MGRNDPDTINWMGETLFPGKSYTELKEMSIDFWLTAEDLPFHNNRVTLRNDGTVKVEYTRTNYTAFEKLKEKLKNIFIKLGELDSDYKDVKWGGYDFDLNGIYNFLRPLDLFLYIFFNQQRMSVRVTNYKGNCLRSVELLVNYFF